MRKLRYTDPKRNTSKTHGSLLSTMQRKITSGLEVTISSDKHSPVSVMMTIGR